MNMWLILITLFAFIIEVFYLFVYPLFRMRICKVGDVYYKNKKVKNPFDYKKKIREEYVILDIKDGYVQYEEVEIYLDSEKNEVRRGWIHSDKLYTFFAFVVALTFKKKKK